MDTTNVAVNRALVAEIPVPVIREVLWQCGGDEILGEKPGSFAEFLLRAFAHADATNLIKLHLAFHDYGTAYHLISRTPDGQRLLTERVKEVLFV